MSTILLALLVSALILAGLALCDNHRLSQDNRRLFLEALKAQDKCRAMAATVTQLQQMLNGK